MYQFVNVVKGQNNIRFTYVIGCFFFFSLNAISFMELNYALYIVKNELVISVILVKLISHIMGHPAVHR